MLYFSGQFILNKLVNEQFLFAPKFSCSIFSKTTDFVNEKVVKMSFKQKQCRNHPDVFCYICGECVLEKYCFNVRDFTKKAYKAYFGIKLGDQVKSCAPHKVCKQCTKTLLRLWTKGEVSSMRFGVPIVWREPTNHHDDCYFCMVDMTGWNQRKKNEWCYPDIESARRPVLHCTEFPVPTFTFLPHLTKDKTLLEAMEDTDSSCSNYSSTSMAAEASLLSTNPKSFSQGQLNDLVRDLNLFKESSKILVSRLEHGRSILDSETKITFFRNRDDLLLRFFTMEDDFVYCNKIPDLLAKMSFSNYYSDEWRLFIDSSKRNACYFIKATILHAFRLDTQWLSKNSIKCEDGFEQIVVQ